MKSLSFYNGNFFEIKSGAEAIKENMIRVLLTSPGERVNNPLFGSKIKQQIFEFDNYLLEDLQKDIVKSLNKWEPRAKINSVSISKLEDYKYEISIDAETIDSNEVISVDLILNT